MSAWQPAIVKPLDQVRCGEHQAIGLPPDALVKPGDRIMVRVSKVWENLRNPDGSICRGGGCRVLEVEGLYGGILECCVWTD